MNDKAERTIHQTPKNEKKKIHKNNCMILVSSRTITKYIQDHENIKFYPNTANPMSKP